MVSVKKGFVSPTPNSLDRKKTSSTTQQSCRSFFWITVFLFFFVIAACLIDYQQAKARNQKPFLPSEVSLVTKDAIDFFYDIPRRSYIMYDSAKGHFIWLTDRMQVGDKTVSQLMFGGIEDEEVSKEYPKFPKGTIENLSNDDGSGRNGREPNKEENLTTNRPIQSFTAKSPKKEKNEVMNNNIVKKKGKYGDVVWEEDEAF